MAGPPEAEGESSGSEGERSLGELAGASIGRACGFPGLKPRTIYTRLNGTAKAALLQSRAAGQAPAGVLFDKAQGRHLHHTIAKRHILS